MRLWSAEDEERRERREWCAREVARRTDGLESHDEASSLKRVSRGGVLIFWVVTCSLVEMKLSVK